MKVRVGGCIAVAIVAALLAGCRGQVGSYLQRGAALPTYSQHGPVIVYNAATLTHYLGEASETYLDRGFVLAYLVQFEGGSGGVLSVATFDMGGRANAKSLFGALAQPDADLLSAIGERAVVDANGLLMRRGNCVIMISAAPGEKSVGRDELTRFAREFDAGLRGI